MTVHVEEVAIAADAAAVAEGLFVRWASNPYTFWLDSAGGPAALARFSFVGTDPHAVVSEDDGCWEALAQAAAPLFDVPLPAAYPAPFGGGLVGYVSYEAASGPRGDDSDAPSGNFRKMTFGAYDAIVCVDHKFNKLYIVSTGMLHSGETARRRAKERAAWLWEETAAVLNGPSASIPYKRETAARGGSASKAWPAGVRSEFTPGQYTEIVEEALGAIRRGELEQVNLSQRFAAATALSGPELYLRLRRTNPGPFAAALHTGSGWILSSSPERFVHIRGDKIAMRPIKGTRPRGGDKASDEALRRELLASEKDKWEHDLIVALAGAELAELCEAGSVEVEERMVLERYATVFHLVSTVAGRLPPRADRIDCVRRLFPAGSVTGRPKERAMQLIAELEPSPRDVYTGSIGYIGVGGNVDFNVAIRTMMFRDGRVHFHAGGAVVAGSSPQAEYDETIDKAEGMVRALVEPDG